MEEFQTMEGYRFSQDHDFKSVEIFDKQHGVTLREMIGFGGFAKVYKCIYKGKICVVKKVNPPTMINHYKGIVSEFMILTHLKHPSLVGLVHCYEGPTTYNFVLEYMKNGTLYSLLEKYKAGNYKIGEKDVLGMFTDIACGIEYLHENNVVHRDLKPENILLDEHHNCKVADFGVSKLVGSHEAMNHTSIGTVVYMAPEIYLGKKYNKKVDIWGLGMIFYEMCMMKYAFSNVDKQRILNNRLTYKVPEIDLKARKYSSDLQVILDVTLQRNPDLRWDVSEICKLKFIRPYYEYVCVEAMKMKLRSKSKCSGMITK